MPDVCSGVYIYVCISIYITDMQVHCRLFIFRVDTKTTCSNPKQGNLWFVSQYLGMVVTSVFLYEPAIPDVVHNN